MNLVDENINNGQIFYSFTLKDGHKPYLGSIDLGVTWVNNHLAITQIYQNHLKNHIATCCNTQNIIAKV